MPPGFNPKFNMAKLLIVVRKVDSEDLLLGFFHACPVYIILGAAFWRLLRKKISLWYAHGSANWILKLAEVCTDIIFTSTPEGCRLKSSKIRIVGQGIDTDLF